MKKIIAWLIVAGVGGAFLTLEFIYPYYNSIFGYSVEPYVEPDQSRARAAVSSLLFDPDSAEFDQLRNVETEGVQFVCGDVKAKDRDGSYSELRAFVYEVKPEIARIDDNEQIARIHATYKPCPENLEPPQPPEAEDFVKKVLRFLPKVDPVAPSTRDSLPSLPKGSSSSPAPNDLKTGLSQFRNTAAGQLTGSEAAATEANGQPTQAEGSFIADLKNEQAWRSDHPPAAWPTFPSDDPLAKPARKRSPEQAIALASDVEGRWKGFKAGRSASRPRPSDIEEALRALLAIPPNSKDFSKAWALFVSLRQIDREAIAMVSRRKSSTGSARPTG
ncbi:hypothetical protein [Bradyrhizobium sp.]|jgi:hypothetical protein|uniref:hypothetical protein n=1 Tax=Bradyrhizobium sp. TaxID=376 RepID=UPI003C14CCFE